MTSHESPKRFLFAQLADVAKALSHAHRIELIDLLVQGERSVEALANIADLTVGNTSQHLLHLRRAGLITSRREGKQVFYRLTDVGVIHLLTGLRSVAEQNVAQVNQLLDQFYRDRDRLEPVSQSELLHRIQSEAVVVLDVRPVAEFTAGHLPSAISIPLDELAQRLHELPHDQEIVAYCRGFYCIFSYDALDILRSKGFKSRRLQDGFLEWRAAGMPIEVAG